MWTISAGNFTFKDSYMVWLWDPGVPYCVFVNLHGTYEVFGTIKITKGTNRHCLNVCLNNMFYLPSFHLLDQFWEQVQAGSWGKKSMLVPQSFSW